MTHKLLSKLCKRMSLSTSARLRPCRKKIFSENVLQVVIEIFSACNRRCSYCPQSLVKRNNEYMADDLFNKILDELREIQYRNYICLNLYNEPLLYFDFLIERMQTVRQKLPNAKMIFSTNGDFLNIDYLNKLYENGLTSLDVTFHHDKNKSWDKKIIQGRIEKFLSDIGHRDQKIVVLEDNIYCIFNFKGMNLKLFSNNFHKVGFDRAGALDNIGSAEPRIHPCEWPIYNFTIAYDGTVYPCCQFFHGIEKHVKYQMCNLKDTNIFDCYMFPKLVDFRNMAAQEGLKKDIACRTCLL